MGNQDQSGAATAAVRCRDAVSSAEVISTARFAMAIEAASIARAAERLDGGDLLRAVNLILQHRRKVVATGMGKSGHIARTIAATLSGTGTPAVFLHPSEAAHGDLGLCSKGDPIILVSNSGCTAELLALIPRLRVFGCPLIGILGSHDCPIASRVDVMLDASVEREADLHNLAPTASAATALAVGHALAVALMTARQFTRADFARLHFGGTLGARA